MKSSMKKFCLFWLSLLWGLWIVSFINITSGADSGVRIKLDTLDSQHTTLLHSLYLWKWDDTDNTWVRLKVSPWGKFLDILNWFVVSEKSANWSLAVIGWWIDNELNWQNAWVGWWQNNRASNNSVIGWWFGNQIGWENSVIVWGYQNNVSNGGVVAWGTMWASEWWVVLWWVDNKAGKNSMVFGWKWWEWSFVWNGVVWDNVAYIGASNWLLIWTNVKKDGVSLVVSGAIKIGDSSLWQWWEIISSNVWCFKANDWNGYQWLGRSSGAWECWSNGSCLFGWVYIQNWDSVKWYSNYYAYGSCGWWVTLKCDNWTLKPNDKTYYPYCHTIPNNDSVYEG